MVSWADLSLQTKKYSHQWHRFAGVTSVTDRQTDTSTDRPRYFVANSKQHVRT